MIWIVSTNSIWDYAKEIHQETRGPMKGIVTHLLEHGKPGERVIITYGDQPVKFYTKMKVFGALSDDDYKKNMDAEWIILRYSSIVYPENLMKAFVFQHLDFKNYKVTVIDYPDTPFENREDPELHYFETPETKQNVVILRRIE